MNVLLSLLLLSSLTVSVQAQQDTVEAHIEFCSGAAGEPAGCTKKLTFTTVTQQAPSYNNAPVGREVTVSLVRDHTLYEDEVVSGTLVTPLSATVRQSPMQQEYQEVYLRDFYGSYTEKASYGALLFVTCTYNGTPPCGPYRTVQGVEVEQNVGLCCQCLLCGNLIDCAGTRRDACNINSVRIVFTCWDPSPDIYEGYQLTKAPLYDALTVEIQGNSMNLTTELPEVTAGGVTVTLVESIAPPVSVRDVSPLYFFARQEWPRGGGGSAGMVSARPLPRLRRR
ncbi:hypothetical protein ADEAN_000035200 [Angomonas deanei]|uniref:Uncharacterized protein n=1 Tax=Angomonas deanei TaxID=59799 RepID=A0A7G2BZK9_9TRYP|nr:hypothetical protein ADEAN_000035200 [Angomonas deanei]